MEENEKKVSNCEEVLPSEQEAEIKDLAEEEVLEPSEAELEAAKENEALEQEEVQEHEPRRSAPSSGGVSPQQGGLRTWRKISLRQEQDVFFDGGERRRPRNGQADLSWHALRTGVRRHRRRTVPRPQTRTHATQHEEEYF